MQSLSLLYHELRPEPSQYSYVVSCAEFEEHCRLYTQLQGDQPQKMLRPQVTFDDGNRSDLQYALPRLATAGLSAHFFITAGWTGERANFMNAAELRELHAAGMTVGAHGWSHKLLTSCTEAELRRELVDAKVKLETILGSAVKTMSLPGGRANGRVLRHCVEAGYKTVFTSEPKPAYATESTVGRLNLRAGTSIEWLRQLLDPASGVLARQQRSDRVKGIAKSLLGDRLYAAAWKIANRHEDDSADAGVAA